MYVRLLLLSALVSSAFAATLETTDFEVGFADTGAFDTGTTALDDTGAFDSASFDTGVPADMVNEPIPLSLDDIPTRACTRYGLRMTLLDTEHYADLLVGGYWWDPSVEAERHYWGTLEAIDLWCEKLGASVRVDVGEIQADVLEARTAAQSAQSAIAAYRDADTEELEQMMIQAQCSLTAATQAIQRAKVRLAAIPPADRTGRAFLWQALDTDVADAELVLLWLSAMLERQVAACQAE